jgi:hypothetical protein
MLSKVILFKLISLSIIFCFIQKEPKERIIDFLNAKNYNYSSSKKDIPKFGLDYLGKTHANEDLPDIYRNNDSIFEIGDSTELNQINIGCNIFVKLDGTPEQKYRRKLNFVLYTDSVCLMTHLASGGIEIVDFIEQKKNNVKHIRYNVGVFMNNIDSLKLAFSNDKKYLSALIINTFD